MACTCPDESCTQVVVDGVTYCDCLVSQSLTCPDGSKIVNIGGGVLVCRTVLSLEPTVCGIITCDTANGFAYNPNTGKCEKAVLTEPCAPGYVFVPTADGVGKCVPPGGVGTLLCPNDYTYDAINKRCTKVTSNPATATSVTSCKADIVIVRGMNGNSTGVIAQESLFINAFINSIATSLDSTSYDLRVGVTTCNPSTISSNNDMPYLYSGPYVSPGGGADPSSTTIKNFFTTSGFNQFNDVTQGLTRAARTLFSTGTQVTITQGGTLLPARSGVRKIIIFMSEHSASTYPNPFLYPFSPCMGNNTSNPGNYPSGFNFYTQMRVAVNQAKCLLAAHPSLEIFSVWSGTEGDPAAFGNREGYFFTDLRSAGGNGIQPFYQINSGNAATLGAQLQDDIFALQEKTGAPAVCGTTTTYSCPVGEMLVGTICKGIEVKPAGTCDPTCTITPSGSNALCTCTLPSVPTQCGTCPVVNNKCSCLTTQEPQIIPTVSSISLDDPKYFEKIEWTISYDPKEKMWISFHDWHPTLLIPAHSHFYTIKNNSFWKHNERFDSFTNYYNSSLDYNPSKDYGWEVEYNIVTPNQVTTLRSIEYYMEAYKYYNDGKDMFHILDENFDRALIYNSEQVSPLLNLKIKDKNNPLQALLFPIAGPINTQILASKEENKYRFNNFYDITKDRQEFSTFVSTVPGFMTPGSGINIPMFITAADGYHKTINPAYIDVLKDPLQHKKFRHFGNKIVLRKTKSGDKKMLLKLVNSKMLNSSR